MTTSEKLKRYEDALRSIASYNADELREWEEENAADMVEIADQALTGKFPSWS